MRGKIMSRCVICLRLRQFSTSSACQVKRPQEPFPMVLPIIDENGRPQSTHTTQHTLKPILEKQRRRQELLQSLAESPSRRAAADVPYGLRLSRADHAAREDQYRARTNTNIDDESATMRSTTTTSTPSNTRSGFGLRQSTSFDRQPHSSSQTYGLKRPDHLVAQTSTSSFSSTQQHHPRIFTAPAPRPIPPELHFQRAIPHPQIQPLSSNQNSPRIDHARVSENKIDTPPVSDQGQQWDPTKRLSFGAMEGLRALHKADPVKYNRSVLSERFGVSEEAVRRILHSNWRSRDDAREAAAPARLDNARKTLSDTKWDKDVDSPAPAIMRAFQR
ncbi:hypothetical protein BCR39DRAFT_501227 [Naematelia encephala]|uniref:Required for respiratory growth protein 9, mitochondrial n=1 Tax=Naematelia encephala TaxID=71784 RepID=A0A1Y2AK66_9TREE|nr:hypothetical protein BCR39DRAFT_501227 [Naematelia encephala]